MKSNLMPIALCLLVILAGCRSIGPGRVAGDRFDYSAAISESWKSQTLLNIVKIRYADPPIFVDVGQIVASRSLSTNINAGGELHNFDNDSFLAIGGSGTYTDQPTITYTPLTGNKFVKSLMTPLTPESVFAVIQSGWPADGVLFMAAASINGLKNQESSLSGTTPPDPEFLRALALLRKVQLSGGVAIRIQQDEQKKVTMLITFRRQDISPETLVDSKELRQLLRLDPDGTDFKLVYGAMSANDKEVAVLTRSILQLMQIMAAQVEVPAQDLADRSAAPGWESAPGMTEDMRMIKIHSSKSYPPHASVAVPYNGHWFWIDNRDIKSKRVFLFMMMMFTLADTGESPPLPQVTIPAR
jgi:hypothetical protein